MRGLLILVGALAGGAVGICGAVVLLTALRAQGGGGPAWELALLVGLGALCALVFAILSAWLTASAAVDRLAVAPTRHFLTVTVALLGGAGGLCLYLALTALAGGPDALAPPASRVFAGALTVLGGAAGFGTGRLIAAKTYY